jgi:hypothetical protein
VLNSGLNNDQSLPLKQEAGSGFSFRAKKQ